MASSPTGRTFVLRSIADLFQVPRDRRAICLAELEHWLGVVEDDMLRHTVPASTGPYIWHDDGVAGCTIDRRELDRSRQDALIVGPGYLGRHPNDTAPRLRDQRVR